MERFEPLTLPDEIRTFTAGDKAVGVGIPVGVAVPGVMYVALRALTGVATDVGVDMILGEALP